MAKVYVYLSAPTGVLEVQLEVKEGDSVNVESGSNSIVEIGGSFFQRTSLLAVVPEEEWKHRTWLQR